MNNISLLKFQKHRNISRVMAHAYFRKEKKTASYQEHPYLTATDSLNDSSPLDEEQIRQLQSDFSHMIDHTCEDEPDEENNIFQHTYSPKEWCSSLFRSIVPSPDVIRQKLEDDLEKQLFDYGDYESGKYTFKVLDRRSNRLIYEQMPSYHRFFMRLLFSGPLQRELLHTEGIKNFFSHETLRLGKAFDEPKSRKHIPGFIKAYQINLNELLKPNIDAYATFNEFFYRKLKPNARPIDEPADPNVIVSVADCRLMVFNDINNATRLWIKGRNFSLKNLLDNSLLAEEFNGGSLAIFRLAPVDYHRFHSPADGTIGHRLRTINGTYYTVNPIAIREKLDVLTENQRKLVIIETKIFGKIAFVAIGALLVGSVNFTVSPDQSVAKGEELGTINELVRLVFRATYMHSLHLGYFAYGGSTIVVAFQAGMVNWDEDLQHNSDNSMETLVRMGERIGRRTTDQEHEERLAFHAKFGKTHSAISSLFSGFPKAKNSK